MTANLACSRCRTLRALHQEPAGSVYLQGRIVARKIIVMMTEQGSCCRTFFPRHYIDLFFGHGTLLRRDRVKCGRVIASLESAITRSRLLAVPHVTALQHLFRTHLWPQLAFPPCLGMPVGTKISCQNNFSLLVCPDHSSIEEFNDFFKLARGFAQRCGESCTPTTFVDQAHLNR